MKSKKTSKTRQKFDFRMEPKVTTLLPTSYLDLEAGDNQSLKIQVARPGIEPRSSSSASQELNHSATAAPVEKKRWTFQPTDINLIKIHLQLCAMPTCAKQYTPGWNLNQLMSQLNAYTKIIHSDLYY